MAKKAKEFIDFIKKNKLEDVEFSTGYDNNEGLTFEIYLGEGHEIMYTFSTIESIKTWIEEIFYVETGNFLGDVEPHSKEITTEEALKLRGLA